MAAFFNMKDDRGMETKGRMINDTALIRQIFRKWRRMVLAGLLVGLIAGGLQAKKLLP